MASVGSRVGTIGRSIAKSVIRTATTPRVLALDLARNVGWAAGPVDGLPQYGHATLEREFWGGMACEFKDVLDSLFLHEPTVVAYERAIVKHPQAGQLLTGLAWQLEHHCAERDVLCVPIPSTTHKKAFLGRQYSKKDKPYPGILECQRRGLNVTTTDEADAVSVWFCAKGWIESGKIEIEGKTS